MHLSPPFQNTTALNLNIIKSDNLYGVARPSRIEGSHSDVTTMNFNSRHLARVCLCGVGSFRVGSSNKNGTGKQVRFYKLLAILDHLDSRMRS